ncbi:Rnf128 [Symbiodinium natans]|uniref:Rnf128 protein n=1 Tax=Symbiodinium natans TaxID=878477 RepID=A0A812VF87_9DINO|nr:Rnf128 [Symbiodinium natans]
MSGEISGVGEPLGSPRESGCAWHILVPSLSLQAIHFHLLDAAFSGNDALIIYGSGYMHASTRVATFHRTNPLPGAMALTGTSEALLVLSAVSNETRVRLRYECAPYGTKLGDTWFSPVGYACVLAAFIVLGFAISLMPVYMVCYCKARRHQDLVMQESQLMIRSELQARRLRSSEAAREEQQVVASLQALPLEMWKDRGNEEVGKRPSCDECCLCLEPYSEEDMLRVLPCQHFFHEACIDRWFSANRFMPRSCPLCQ